MTVSNPLPADLLELRAAEQRHELHGTVADLKDVLRQRLDVKANARQRLIPAAGLMAVVGIGIGYGVAGFFFPESRKLSRTARRYENFYRE